MEGRYNLANIPIDLGLQLSSSTFKRTWASGSPLEQYFRTTSFLIVSDYNFFRGGKVSPFAGLGLGVTQNDGFGVNSSGCIMPRVGVELFNNHLRLSLDYKITQKENRHMSFTIGCVFGGGRK